MILEHTHRALRAHWRPASHDYATRFDFMLTGPLFLFSSLIRPLSLPALTSFLCEDLSVLSFTHAYIRNQSPQYPLCGNHGARWAVQIKSITIDQTEWPNKVRSSSSSRQLSCYDKMGLCCPLLVKKTLTHQNPTKSYATFELKSFVLWGNTDKNSHTRLPCYLFIFLNKV